MPEMIPDFVLRDIETARRFSVAETLERYPDRSIHAQCLALSHFMVGHLASAGYAARQVAGTAAWKLVPDEADDGKANNFFSYVFSKDALAPLQEGKLPEMHCWNAIAAPFGGWLLIDVTWGSQPFQSAELAGIPFHPECVPPAQILVTKDHSSNSYHYTPDPIASLLARVISRDTFGTPVPC